MADNVLIDNGALTDYDVATDKVTYSGDADRDLQLTKPVHVAGAEGAKTVEAVTQTVASAAPAAAVMAGGTDGTNVRHLKTDTSGELQVDVLTLPALVAGSANIGDVDVLTLPAVTGTGTFAVQVDGSALTSLQLADNVVVVLGTDTYTEATSSGTVMAAVRRDADTTLASLTNEYTPLQVDANGRLKVEAFSGEALPVTLTSTTITGTVAVTQSGTWDEVGINDSGNSITVDAPVGTPAFVRLSDGAAAITTLAVSLASLPASTNTIEVVGDAAHDATLAGNPVLMGGASSAAAPADVTADGEAVRSWHLRNGAQATVITAAGALIGGDATNGLDVDVIRLPASTNTIEIVGDVAHSAGIAGNPLTVGGVSIDTDDTAPPNRVDVEADATRIGVDRDGTVFVRTHGPQIWTYHVNGSSALTDATVHASPGGSLSLYVTSITFSSGAATAINMFLEEGASTVMGPYYLEAVAGRGMHLTFPTPRKITPSTALTITTSAAIAHSVDIVGFTAQG